MDRVDFVLIGIFVVLNITCFILSRLSPNNTIRDIGNWFVMLTHLLIVPSILMVYETRWYFAVLLYSLMTSIMYHLSKIGYYGLLDKFDRWDVASQNVLIMSTFFLLVFHHIPEWAFLVIAGSGVFMGAVGDAKMGAIQMYEFISGIIFLLLFVYLVIRTCHPIPSRNNKYIGMACGAAIVAGISFVVAGESDNRKYGLIHSIWHCSAYIMLYFALKSIKNPYQQLLRRERTNLGEPPAYEDDEK